MKLTVIIRDDSPFIHLQEPPNKRSVYIELTEEQKLHLTLNHTGFAQGTETFETLSCCFLEGSELELRSNIKRIKS